MHLTCICCNKKTKRRRLMLRFVGIVRHKNDYEKADVAIVLSKAYIIATIINTYC